jgi:anti-sigma regulatory factor (Ser/Thr protein kinase)
MNNNQNLHTHGQRGALGARGRGAPAGKVLIVGCSVRPSAAWVLPAEPSSVSQLRRRAVEFASTAGTSEEVIQAIALAVSETVTNAVARAYDGEDRGQVRVSCHVEGVRFVVEVADEGVGIGAPRGSSGIGHGLAMVGALVQRLEIAPGPARRGTAVTMAFGPAPALSAPPGLEMLCALALETVADVSCVDLVHEGVLRRIAAEVADHPTLTTWLRAAVPPAKPGTATWSALREGGARLIVHDPLSRARRVGPGSVLTSPGGSRSHSRSSTEPQRRSGASAAAGVDMRYRPRRSSASSPMLRAVTLRRLPRVACCAVGSRWRAVRTSGGGHCQLRSSLGSRGYREANVRCRPRMPSC